MTSFKRITEQLIPFFVSRQLFCGAGKVGSENRGQPCDLSDTELYRNHLQ